VTGSREALALTNLDDEGQLTRGDNWTTDALDHSPIAAHGPKPLTSAPDLEECDGYESNIHVDPSQ